MKIGNRSDDVIKLRCHICQTFIKMIAVDNWRTVLYPFVQEKIKGPYKDKYVEQYKAMRQKGIENYSFDDMDVSFIVNILQYCPKIAIVTPTKDMMLFKSI